MIAKEPEIQLTYLTKHATEADIPNINYKTKDLKQQFVTDNIRICNNAKECFRLYGFSDEDFQRRKQNLKTHCTSKLEIQL